MATSKQLAAEGLMTPAQRGAALAAAAAATAAIPTDVPLPAGISVRGEGRSYSLNPAKQSGGWARHAAHERAKRRRERKASHARRGRRAKGAR